MSETKVKRVLTVDKELKEVELQLKKLELREKELELKLKDIEAREKEASIKEQSTCRDDFLAILNAYLEVGWPEAVKLALDLKDSFR